MSKQKINPKTCKHESDYLSCEITWQGEDNLCEEVTCQDCGARGFREFVFENEEWWDRDEKLTKPND